MHSFGKKQNHKNDKFGNKMEFGMIFGKKMERNRKIIIIYHMKILKQNIIRH